MGFLKQVGSLLSGTLLTVLFFLNTFGGLVGGIWLLCIGEWKLVLGTFFITFIVPMVFSLVMLPAFGFGILGVKAMEKENVIGLILCGVISTLYSYIVLSAWSLFVFDFFNRIHHEFGINYTPLLLWGYSIATGPFFYMASKDNPNELNMGSSMGCFFLMLIYIVFCLNLLIQIPILNLLMLVIAATCFSAFQTATITVMAIEEKRNNNYFDEY